MNVNGHSIGHIGPRLFLRWVFQGVSGTLLLFSMTGCRPDMFQQPKENPLSASDFFANGASARPLVPGTVARGQLEENQSFYTGKLGTNLVQSLPIALNRDLLERGRERYNIYCSVCHGATGEGNGMIPQRGYPAPPSYHVDRLRQAPIGHFFDVMTQGYGVMYSYASRVAPEDRWAIAAYIRTLQLSRAARLDDVPPAERVKLESPTR